MFVTPAYAQTAGAAPAGGASFLIPMLLIFGIMYFFMIRPQQKKIKEHQAMVAGLRRGDRIITQGGVVGKVTKVLDDRDVEVEIAKEVKIRVVKSTVAQVLTKTEPAEPAKS